MTPNDKTIAQRVRDIVLDDLHTDDAAAVTDDQALFYVAASESRGDAQTRGCVGLDSLDRVEIVMALEDEFDIEIPDDDVEPPVSATSAYVFGTLGGITAYIEGRLA